MPALFIITDDMIDRGAKLLRERQQGGKGNLLAWDTLPNAAKKKWREHVRQVLQAASINPAS